MPKTNHSELEKLVADGGIGAISIDTSIFDQFACNLDSPSLEALEQFIGSPVQVILSDVVLGEVRSHLTKSAADATVSLTRALADFARFRKGRRLASKKAAELLNVAADVAAEANGRLDEYVQHIQAVTLTAGEYLNPDALLADYLAAKAPFENAKGKKAEFPDAIALMEIEQWAEKNQKYVLVVSKDKGWFAFAERSEWVLAVDDLSAALGLFHKADRHIVERTASLLRDSGKYQLAAEMDSVLQSFVDDISPWIDAQSPFQFHANYYGASIKTWSRPTADSITVIESDKESVTMTTKITLTVEAEAEFAFYVHDTGDDINVGGAYAVKDVDIEVPIVIKVARESGPDDIAISMSYEARRSVSLDFGYIEPHVEED